MKNSINEEKIMNGINISDAIEKNDINLVKEYIYNNDDDINIKDDDKYAPLHWAAEYGADNIAQYLIANGADINIKDDGGYAPLHCAVINECESTVQYLVANGADINIQNGRGDTPLHWALLNGFDTIVQYLIANGADANIQNIDGRTALHHAAAAGYDSIVQSLITNRADANIKDRSGSTPLLSAANFDYFSVENTPTYIPVIRLLLSLTHLTDSKDMYRLYKSVLNEDHKGIINELIMNRDDERYFTFCELFSIGTNGVEDNNNKQEKNSLMIGYDAPLDEEEVRPFPPMFDSNLDESLFDATLVSEIWEYGRDFLRAEEIENYKII